MKILYITNLPLEKAYSGTAKQIRDNFIYKGNKVIECIVPLPDLKLVKLKKSILYKIFKKIYIYKRNNLVIKLHMKNIRSKIQNLNYDIIFSHYEWNLVDLRVDKPIFCWPDNFITDFINFYSSPWSNISINNALKQTKKYYKNTTATIYSSEWAFKSAKKNTLVHTPIHFVRYGSAFPVKNISNKDLLLLKSKSKSKLQLLWIGLDPVRKGLNKSIRVVEKLNNNGIDSQLNVIGISGSNTENIKYFGKLAKNVKDDLELFRNIMINSDLFLFFTTADSTPMVIGEALSFGIPVLANNVGGIPSLLNEQCGKLFDIRSSDEEILKWIIDYRFDTLKKNQMIKASIQFAQEFLNWEKSIDCVIEIINSYRQN